MAEGLDDSYRRMIHAPQDEETNTLPAVQEIMTQADVEAYQRALVERGLTPEQAQASAIENGYLVDPSE